jgi:YtkA-like
MHLCLPPQGCHRLTTGRIRQSPWRCLAAGVLLAGLAGCQPPGGRAAHPGGSETVELSWSLAPQPPTAGPVRLSLTLTEKATAEPVTGATVRLEANMSHPGMRPVFGAAGEVAPGRYVAPFELTMAGDWFLLIDVSLRDGRTLRWQVELPPITSKARPR